MRVATFSRRTYRVRLGGVEERADNALFLDLAEDGLGVLVGEGGRHFGGVMSCCVCLSLCEFFVVERLVVVVERKSSSREKVGIAWLKSLDM